MKIKKNIHFYINCLGFHATEFFNPHHKDPNIPDDMVGGDYFFHFEKQYLMAAYDTDTTGKCSKPFILENDKMM